jgi:glycosyltransferase involved in cell wall biosynthesis
MSFEKPLVSIVCVTYNHEKYIKNTLDGFVMQKTNFLFEIIIHDDASTDNTSNIIREYESKYKDLFKPIYQTENQASQERGRVTSIVFNAVKGKYITICEGDDYWVSPSKLQEQFDLMELNSSYSLCFTSVDILDTFSNSIYPEIQAEDRIYTIDELLISKFAHTVTFFFRKELLDTSIFFNENVFAGDLFLLLDLAQKGKVFGASKVTSVYRKHLGGITYVAKSKLGIKHYERFVRQFILIKKQFTSISKSKINTKIVDYSITVFLFYLKKGNPKALKYLIQIIYYRPELLWKGLLKPFKRK